MFYKVKQILCHFLANFRVKVAVPVTTSKKYHHFINEISIDLMDICLDCFYARR
jgi:hypothetical protein